MSSSLYYKHSGKVGTFGPILVFLVGPIVAAILATVYAFAIFYIPFIYLNVVIAYFVGLIIGSSLHKLGRFFKIRSFKFVFISSLVLGCFAVYVSWVIWIYAYSEYEYIIINPLDILESMKFFAIEGVWSIKNMTPTGFVLYIFWFIEAMIIVIATLMHASSFSDNVFCEPCNSWIENSKRLPLLEKVNDPEALKSKLETGDLSSLLSLERKQPKVKEFTEVVSMNCLSCHDSYLLSVYNVVKVETVEKGVVKEERKQVPIIERLYISESKHKSLMSNWYKKDKKEDVEEESEKEV